MPVREALQFVHDHGRVCSRHHPDRVATCRWRTALLPTPVSRRVRT